MSKITKAERENAKNLARSISIITTPHRSADDRSTPLLRIKCERIENSLDRGVLPDSGIDHQVKAMPVRPLDVEVLLNEVGAVTVYRLRKFDRFLLAFACGVQPANSFLKWGVDEDVKRVGARTEIISRSSPHNDAVAGIC